MSERNTIEKEVSFEGIGLHTGTIGKITCKPAISGNGIRFLQAENKKIIHLKTENVVSTNRGTCICKDEFEVHTIEHLLSALSILKIDDVDIIIDGKEIPILDGSALPFFQAFNKVGIKVQSGEPDIITIDRNEKFVDPETGAEFLLSPSNNCELKSTIVYEDPIIGTQKAEIVNGENYESDIAPARTFVLGSELEKLLAYDLIKGGRIDNALVFRDKAITDEKIEFLRKKLNINEVITEDSILINNTDLRFANEPARHKLLDLIGDLYLTGKRIKGKIIAIKPGHTSNLKLARFIESTFNNKE